MAVALPIAPCGAGVMAGLREFEGGRQDRKIVDVQHRRQAGTPADFKEMTKQAESGDIGHAMNAGDLAQMHAHTVEARRNLQHFLVSGISQFTLFQRRPENADSKGLAQYQKIVLLCGIVAPYCRQVSQADRRQTVYGFRGIDGVTAGNGNARFPACGGATGQDFADAILEGRQSDLTGPEGREVLRFSLAVIRSGRERREVSVDEVTD